MYVPYNLGHFLKVFTKYKHVLKGGYKGIEYRPFDPHFTVNVDNA